MMMNKDEMMKLLDYILENKDIVIGERGLFNRDTLIMIRAIVKGKLPNDFQLSEKQKEIIINSFLKSNNGFDVDTPAFIIGDRRCDLKAIKNDINSINFINVSYEDDDLKKYIIDEALKQNFVLKRYTPSWLGEIYDVALNSIKVDNSSADFIDWYSFSKEQVYNLIKVLIKGNYVISSNSCSFLAENKVIVLKSIKKDTDNIRYAAKSMLFEPEIFKYLLVNGYEFNDAQLRNNGIFQLKDMEIMDFYFKEFGVYNNVPKEIRKNFKRIINSSLNASPTLKDFESIFDMVAEEEWRKYRKDHFDMFENIFGKICSQLQNCDGFEDVINSLDFDSRMEKTLGDKYNMIYNAMKEFFEIYHSDVNNKLEKLQLSRNIIAKLSALYVSKSKEDYKKEQLDEYYETIKPYFSLKKEHPIVIKKIIQQEQKNKFEELYDNKDAEVRLFLDEILKKYSSQLSEDTIELMIGGFASYHHSNLDYIISPPSGYYEYKRFEKVCKLINRLNNSYIQFDGVEVNSYKDLIEYDENNKLYIYSGKIFNAKEIENFNNYNQKEKIFSKIKKDIMSRVRTIEIKENEIDEWEYKVLAQELPFEDEYFRFDANDALKNIDFSQLKNILDIPRSFNVESFTNQESLNGIYNLLVNNGIILLLLILYNDSDIINTFVNSGINAKNIFEIMNNMPAIVSFAKEFKIDISDFSELSSVHIMSKCADGTSLSVLGKDIIQKLCKYRAYTEEHEEKIIELATDLVCAMSKKDKSTVPYISGEISNYKYSMYDSLDETLLLAGINTDACFRVDGNDHDFLHYCALNKNGFVIKITDYFGNFIARASGFRNGNAVYINQLRTIYDAGGNNYNGEYGNEQDDIIETFEQACKDIVSISQNNPKEKNKIDFVFVNQSYALDDYPSNVSDDVESAIGDIPMDNKSEDWTQYIENTNNLRESVEKGYFCTDYGDYSIICFASSKGEREIVPEDIKPKNVPALYERKRNKILATSTPPDLEVYRKVNKINAIKRYYENEDYQEVEIPIGSVIFTGDNWFIIFNNGTIINSCLLDFDEKAKIEFEIAKKELDKFTLAHGQQQINIEQVSENIQSQSSPKGYIKKLKINN